MTFVYEPGTPVHVRVLSCCRQTVVAGGRNPQTLTPPQRHPAWHFQRGHEEEEEEEEENVKQEEEKRGGQEEEEGETTSAGTLNPKP